MIAQLLVIPDKLYHLKSFIRKNIINPQGGGNVNISAANAVSFFCKAILQSFANCFICKAIGYIIKIATNHYRVRTFINFFPYMQACVCRFKNPDLNF